MESLATGLAKGLDSYLQLNNKNQQEVGMANYKSQLETQKNETETKYKQSLEGTITPDSGKELFSKVSPEFGDAAYNALTQFKTKNGRDMTLKEANDTLDPIMKSLESKNSKSNIKHYMGNDPEGNAIFSDNSGNMFGPDGNIYSGKVLPKSSTMPTSSTRSSAEFATTILPHITEMRSLIAEADKAGYIGPGAGRVYNQFMAGKIGSTGDDKADMLLGKLRSMDSLLKTGAMRVHFGSRGGQNMYEHFSQMLNTGKQSAALLNGSLDTMENFMKGYADAGNLGGEKHAPTSTNKDPLGLGI